MKKRLYFLLPDIETTRKVVDELLLARVDERFIHVISRSESELAGLPKATMLQKTDLVHGMELGLFVGGLTGTIAGVVLTLIPSLSSIATGGMVLAVAIAGALIGTWAAGMIGISINNTRLAKFEQAIAQGQVLLMVDLPKTRVREISSLITSHYPSARSGGTEPTIPAFP